MKPGHTRFAGNETGNVAMIAALVIIPIAAIAGFAIDFQVTTTQKARIQQAVDSAVLAATKSMQDGKDRAYSLKEANDYFSGILNQSNNSGLNCTKIELTYFDETEELEGHVSCSQTTTLSQIIGIKNLDFQVSSAATYGIGKLEIAFVFDVSGSMANENRMTNLKVAAREAVDILLPPAGSAGNPEDVRLAMVSYDTMVNAGPYFKAVTNEDPTRTYTFNGEVRMCVETVPNGPQKWQCSTPTSGGNDGTPKVVTGPETCKWVQPTKCGTYEWVPNQSRTRTVTSTCVWEREGAQRYTDAGPGPGRWLTAIHAAFNANSNGWSVNNATNPYCNTDVPVPLTYNRAKLNTFINGMTPRQNTAGHIGTAWGWYLLAPEWNSIWPAGSKALPYDEPDATKVLIMMSDGEYNQIRPGSGNPNSPTQARALCDEMKKKGIIIYTVGFNAPASGQAVLNHCALSPDFAFKPTNGQELTEAYKDIALSISDLRISR